MYKSKKSASERFWEKVGKRGTNECWPWLAYIRPDGYGKFKHQGKHMAAHRTAWILTNGDIPKHDSHHGICVCHSCDNRSCVNPAHLFLATQAENLRDRDNKGRQVSPKSWYEGHMITHDGKTMSVCQWAKHTGIPRTTIRARIQMFGWEPCKALTTSV